MTLSGLVQNFSGAMAARWFLGVTEAGFFPAAVTLVGDWYPRHQLQSRISVSGHFCVLSKLTSIGILRHGRVLGRFLWTVGVWDPLHGRCWWSHELAMVSRSIPRPC